MNQQFSKKLRSMGPNKQASIFKTMSEAARSQDSRTGGDYFTQKNVNEFLFKKKQDSENQNF